MNASFNSLVRSFIQCTLSCTYSMACCYKFFNIWLTKDLNSLKNWNEWKIKIIDTSWYTYILNTINCKEWQAFHFLHKTLHRLQKYLAGEGPWPILGSRAVGLFKTTTVIVRWGSIWPRCVKCFVVWRAMWARLHKAEIKISRKLIRIRI